MNLGWTRHLNFKKCVNMPFSGKNSENAWKGEIVNPNAFGASYHFGLQSLKPKIYSFIYLIV